MEDNKIYIDTKYKPNYYTYLIKEMYLNNPELNIVKLYGQDNEPMIMLAYVLDRL